MNQRAAFSETVSILEGRVDDNDPLFIHIKEMEFRLEKWFSEAKLGRWLGWIQGVACAKNWMTLDEAKEVNKRYSDNG